MQLSHITMIFSCPACTNLLFFDKNKSVTLFLYAKGTVKTVTQRRPSGHIPGSVYFSLAEAEKICYIVFVRCPQGPNEEPGESPGLYRQL